MAVTEPLSFAQPKNELSSIAEAERKKIQDKLEKERKEKEKLQKEKEGVKEKENQEKEKKEDELTEIFQPITNQKKHTTQKNNGIQAKSGKALTLSKMNPQYLTGKITAILF